MFRELNAVQYRPKPNDASKSISENISFEQTHALKLYAPIIELKKDELVKLKLINLVDADIAVDFRSLNATFLR